MPDSVCSMSKVIDIVIPAGATGLASTVIDIRGYTHMALELPAGWVSAPISFKSCSTETGTYTNVVDETKAEIKTSSIDASSTVIFSSTTMVIPTLHWIQIRSGTASSPVNQTGSPTIKAILKS